jgi:DNA-binding transcriptional MerR regulator
MKEKILTFLKSKLTGVSESFLSGVADTFSKTIKEEKDIETVFTDGIIDTLKFSATQLQIEGDRRATEAQKTALKNFQEKHGLNEDGTPIKKVGRPKKDADSDNSDDDEKMPKWAEKLLAKNAELEQKIEAQAQEKTLAGLSERVSKHEKLKDIPQSYLKGRNLVPKSEAEIDQLVATIEADYNGFKQEMAEKGVVISVPPTGGGQQGEKVTIDAYLDEKFPKKEVLTKK